MNTHKKFVGRLLQQYTFMLAALILIFVPLPAAAGYTFGAACDGGGGEEGSYMNVLPALMEHMVKNNPSIRFLIFPGDMIAGSSSDAQLCRREMEAWKKAMAPVYNHPRMAEPKIWVTVGNHEVKSKESEECFLKAFPHSPKNGPEDEKGFTYSFDYEGDHFVSVKTDRWIPPDPGDRFSSRSRYVACLDWLEKDLAAARKKGARHIFVFGHQPAFPIGPHIGGALPNVLWILKHPKDPDRDRQLKLRDRFWDILARHRVTAYICGHEHAYARQSVRGVYQVITGGGGAPIFGINAPFGEEPRNLPDWAAAKFEDLVPYYRILGYPHGPGDKCQASNDFVGGRFFEYVLFHVSQDSVTVCTYGADPAPGFNDRLPENYRIELKDSFVISPCFQSPIQGP
jgi:hypothetical protein